MDIGRTNKRVTFCRYENVTNSLSQTVQKIVRVRTVWASVEPKSTREVIAANKDHPELTTIITTRYFKDYTKDMFIEYNGRQFKIVGIPRNIRENNEMLEFTCVEKVDERRTVVNDG